MAVQVRIEGATDTVDEPRDGDRVGWDRDERPRGRPANGDGAAFHVVEGGVDGALVGGQHLSGHLGRAQGVEHAHRLRGAEAEVEGGHGDPMVGWAQPPQREGIVALEHRPQRVAVHLPAASPASAAPVPSHRPGASMPVPVPFPATSR